MSESGSSGSNQSGSPEGPGSGAPGSGAGSKASGTGSKAGSKAGSKSGSKEGSKEASGTGSKASGSKGGSGLGSKESSRASSAAGSRSSAAGSSAAGSSNVASKLTSTGRSIVSKTSRNSASGVGSAAGSGASSGGSSHGSSAAGSGAPASGSGVGSGAPGSGTPASGAGSKAGSKAASAEGASSSAGSAEGAPASGQGSSAGGSAAGGGSVTSPASATASGTASQASSPAASQSAAATPESSATPGNRSKHRKKGDLDLNLARIGFLGAGKMAESLVEGILKHTNIPAKHIFVAAPSKKNLVSFKEKGCHTSRRLLDIFAKYDCDVIFCCFHGSVVQECYKQGGNRPFPITTNYIPNNRHPIYILSLVSGVSLDRLKACLLNPENPRKYILETHRIMANTAVAQGVGICAVDCDPDSKKLSAPIKELLSRFSKLEYVPEDQMDAACAIGGSGLAFSYYYINALADGAFKCGLSRPTALKLAAKTALCAAKSLIESSKHPSELKDEVTAPGGAAIFGVHILDRAEVASGVTAAVEASHKRAHEMSTGSG